MKVKVRAFGKLTVDLGRESTFELVTDAKLRDLISILRSKSKALKKGFLDRYERTESELTVLLNGRNVLSLQRLQTPLKDGDTIVLLPQAIGG